MSAINLTTREFVGTIVEVLKTPGLYKVIIDELVSLTNAGGIIVRDESIPARYTNSKVGTYGTFYPLQVGTKVTIRFKRNNLNSGIITGVLSYEHPCSDKHPNYYLIVKTLSNSQIYADDKDSEVKISLFSNKSHLTLKPDKTILHSGKNNIIEGVKVVNVNAPKIHLNGGSDVSDTGSGKILGPISNITYPSPIYTGDIPTIATNTSANPSNISPQLPESNTINTSDNREVNSYVETLNIPEYHTAEYQIISFDHISNTFSDLSNQINNAKKDFEKIYTQAKTTADTDFNDTENTNILPYYYDMLDLYNQNAAAIDELRNSNEYNSLPEDKKSELDDRINVFTNLMDQAKAELEEIQKTFDLSDTLQDYPNYDPHDYDPVLSSYREVYNDLIDLNYLSTFDTIQSTTNSFIERYKSYSTISNLSSMVNKALRTVKSTFIDDSLNSLLEFKRKYYNQIDDSHISLITSDKLLKNTLDSIINYTTGIKSLLQKAIYNQNTIKNTFPSLTMTDTKIIEDITSYIDAYNNHSISLENIINSITGKIPQLRNAGTHNIFFDIFDSIYQDVYSLKNLQTNIAGDLQSHILSISYNFESLLYNTKSYTENLIANTIKNTLASTYFIGKDLPPVFQRKFNNEINELTDCIVDAVSDTIESLLNLILDDVYTGVREYVYKIIRYIAKLSGVLSKYFDYLLHVINLILNVLLQHNGIYNKSIGAIHNINNNYLCNISNIVKTIGLTITLGKLTNNQQIHGFLSKVYNKVSPLIPPQLSKDIQFSTLISDDEITITTNNRTIKIALI